MKSAFVFFLSSLFAVGVFGESVSVKEGDSVTLHTGAGLQSDERIEWRFNNIRIARVIRNKAMYDDVVGFKDRLQLDIQTGDLKIFRITDSGLYMFEIISPRVSSEMKFSFSVRPAEMGPISVMERDFVTLKTVVPEIHRYDEIRWRFGHQNSSIAEVNRKAGIYSTNDGPDGRFRDRLQLDCLNGSLTISNIETRHSGLYEVDISGSSSKHTIHKTINVTVSGALIPQSVKEGNPVTLNSNLPEIQTNDIIQWKFGDTNIASINQTAEPFYDDGTEFKGRLKVNHQTGSLTITKTNKSDSGHYKLQISSGRRTILRTISVTVIEKVITERGLSPGATTGIFCVVLLFIAAVVAGVIYYLKLFAPKKKTLYVTEGEPVPLETDIKIQRGDEIQWIFEDCVIAEIKGEHGETYTYDGPDERFKERLELRKISGSLTIRNITTKDAGKYTLKMRRRWTPNKIFSVKISEMKAISKMEENDVILKTDTKIKKDVRMLWLFGDSLIAEIKGGTGEIIRYDDKRLRDGLDLDKTTGDLHITDNRAEHTGIYKLKIISDKELKNKGFCVFVKERMIPVKDGTSVFLKTDVKIQKDDQMLWTFGVEKSLIAQIKGRFLTCIDDRFKHRLELNEETGCLTIRNTGLEHTGLYEVQILSSRKISCRRFNVVLYEETVKVFEGGLVTLKTGLTEIQKNSHIVWRFGDHVCPIAEIKGGTDTYPESPDRSFKDRLKLDKTTGSLTITNITYEHNGDYKLQIISDEGIRSKIFCVPVITTIMGEKRKELARLMEGKPENKSATVEMPLLNEEVPDGVNEEGTSSL